MFKYPTPPAEIFKKGFVILNVGVPGSFTYSIVGYDEKRDERWFFKQEPIDVAGNASVANQLAAQYELAICLETCRHWFKRCFLFKYLETSSPFDPGLSIQCLEPRLRHQCVLRIMSQCFDSYEQAYELRHQYWIAKKQEVPVPIREYFLSVPFDQKEEAKRCGAIRPSSPFVKHWIINMETVRDVRPLLKWAHPEDHQFLLNVCRRKRLFEQQFGDPALEAEERFLSDRGSAIEKMLMTYSILDSW